MDLKKASDSAWVTGIGRRNTEQEVGVCQEKIRKGYSEHRENVYKDPEEEKSSVSLQKILVVSRVILGFLT